MLRRIVRSLWRRGIGSCVSQIKRELSPWLEFGLIPQICPILQRDTLHRHFRVLPLPVWAFALVNACARDSGR